jgi:hypothetical protein
MKNKIIYLFILFCFSFSTTSLHAQDIIELLDGREIKGNVLEVNADVVKYKAWDQSGATEEKKVLKSDVFKIKYANGFVDAINKPRMGNVIPKPSDNTFPDIVTPKQSTVVEPKPSAVVESKPPTDEQKTEVVEPKKPLITPKPKTKEEEELNFVKVSEIPKPEEPIIRHWTFGAWGGVSLPIGVYSAQSLDDYNDAFGAKIGVSGGGNIGYRLNRNVTFLLEGQFTLHPYAVSLSDVRWIYTLKGDLFHTNSLGSLRLDLPIISNNRRTILSAFVSGGAGVGISTMTGDFYDLLNELSVTTISAHIAYAASAGLNYQGINLGARYTGGNPAFGTLFKPLVSQIQVFAGYQF